jgi:hypothetical protein
MRSQSTGKSTIWKRNNNFIDGFGLTSRVRSNPAINETEKDHGFLVPACTMKFFQAFDLVFFVAFKRIKQMATRKFRQTFADESIIQFLQAFEQLAK